MKKYLIVAMFLVLTIALTSPFSVSAKTKAGAKPGSFFYFFDKAIEKTNLFFTFNPEKKAKKVLEYAEERLAEMEELKKEEEEKEITEDKKEAPEIKKEEINEIKTSEKEIEKADNNLEEEKNEEMEIKDDKKEEANKKDEQSKEIEKLKKEIEALKQKTPQIKVVEKIIEKPVISENKQSSSSQVSSQAKQKEVTLPTLAPEIIIDKDFIQQDEKDYASVFIKTKMSDGQILPNISMQITQYQCLSSDSKGCYQEKKDVSTLISNYDGIVSFNTITATSNKPIKLLIWIFYPTDKNVYPILKTIGVNSKYIEENNFICKGGMACP